jgi:hypothetical protein
MYKGKRYSSVTWQGGSRELYNDVDSDWYWIYALLEDYSHNREHLSTGGSLDPSCLLVLRAITGTDSLTTDMTDRSLPTHCCYLLAELELTDLNCVAYAFCVLSVRLRGLNNLSVAFFI